MLTFFVVGGVVILVAGPVVDGARSIALLATGGLWLVGGSVGWVHRRRMALKVELDGDQLTFDLRERTLVVPVREVREIRRPGYDINRLDFLLVSTATEGRSASRRASMGWPTWWPSSRSGIRTFE